MPRTHTNVGSLLYRRLCIFIVGPSVKLLIVNILIVYITNIIT